MEHGKGKKLLLRTHPHVANEYPTKIDVGEENDTTSITSNISSSTTSSIHTKKKEKPRKINTLNKKKK